MTDQDRIYLSPPEVGPREFELLKEAFDSNWIAPVGPFIERFEKDICRYTGAKHAVALSSGTAALFLGLKVLGVGPGDEVIVPSMTFIASASPVTQLGAKPIFIDSCADSWNLDPEFLSDFLHSRAAVNKLPKAVIVVHLYGQCADMDPIMEVCRKFDVQVVEDAAESLGATYKGQQSGTFGEFGIFSFNGNKIITTSGGGMLVTDNQALADKARYLSTQAREPVAHYEHKEIGYNFRMSNLLAALGVAQLEGLDDKIKRRKAIFAQYQEAFAANGRVEMMPIASYGEPNYWLSCVHIASPQQLDLASIVSEFHSRQIEVRNLWKPLHLQPALEHFEKAGGLFAERLFASGICLPSGSAMSATSTSIVARMLSSLVS